MTNKKLLIDISYLAFLATNINTEGKNIQEKNKIFLSFMLNQVEKTIKENGFTKEDTYICFDSEKEYWRKKIFPPYKENRVLNDKKVETNTLLNNFHELLSKLNFNTIKEDSFEADEIIYFLVKKNKELGNESTVFSVDGDMQQLIFTDKNVKFISPRLNSEISYQREDVLLKHYEKIITGDSKDNIPNLKNGIDIPEIQKYRFGKITVKDLIVKNIDFNNSFEKINDDIKKLVIESFEKINPDSKQKILENFELNETLKDFTKIPEFILEKLKEMYDKSIQNNQNLDINQFQLSIYLKNSLDERKYKKICNDIQIPLIKGEEFLDYKKYNILLNEKGEFLYIDDKEYEIKDEGNNNCKKYIYEIQKNEQIKINSEFHKVSKIFSFNENMKQEIYHLIKGKEDDILDLFKKYNLNIKNNLESTINNLQSFEDIIRLKTAITAVVKLEIEKDPKTVFFFKKHMPNFDSDIFKSILSNISDKKINDFLEESIEKKQVQNNNKNISQDNGLQIIRK